MLNWWRKWFRTNKAVFPFEKKTTRMLGLVYKPVVTVTWFSPSGSSQETVRMLLDTGADYTILPKYLAVLLNIDLQKSTKKSTTLGVGGETTVYYLDQLSFKIGNLTRKAPVGFIDSTRVPPLLGRHLLLETFKITLDKNRQIVFQS